MQLLHPHPANYVSPQNKGPDVLATPALATLALVFFPHLSKTCSLSQECITNKPYLDTNGLADLLFFTSSARTKFLV